MLSHELSAAKIMQKGKERENEVGREVERSLSE